jgi:hypothetical protein
MNTFEERVFANIASSCFGPAHVCFRGGSDTDSLDKEYNAAVDCEA